RQRDLFGRGKQLIPTGPVHEQGQAVGRAENLAASGRALDDARSDDLDVALLELGPQGRQLLVVEVVLVGERLERLLLDCAPILGLLQELEDRYVKVHGGQFCSLPLDSWGGLLRFDPDSSRVRLGKATHGWKRSRSRRYSRPRSPRQPG